jgi:Sulfatase-modifying factor enzyme 1
VPVERQAGEIVSYPFDERGQEPPLHVAIRVERKLCLRQSAQDHHLAGNVWEWCRDWYREDYSEAERADPLGPEQGLSRVMRGGAFDYNPNNLRGTNRNNNDPDNENNNIGFRVAWSAAGAPDGGFVSRSESPRQSPGTRAKAGSTGACLHSVQPDVRLAAGSARRGRRRRLPSELVAERERWGGGRFRL